MNRSRWLISSSTLFLILAFSGQSLPAYGFDWEAEVAKLEALQADNAQRQSLQEPETEAEVEKPESAVPSPENISSTNTLSTVAPVSTVTVTRRVVTTIPSNPQLNNLTTTTTPSVTPITVPSSGLSASSSSSSNYSQVIRNGVVYQDSHSDRSDRDVVVVIWQGNIWQGNTGWPRVSQPCYNPCFSCQGSGFRRRSFSITINP